MDIADAGDNAAAKEDEELTDADALADEEDHGDAVMADA